MAQVEMIIDSVRQSPVNNGWVVILRDKATERYLPIYIGSSQADIIKRELLKTDSPEPIDHDLSFAGIDTTSSRLESVTINRFEKNVFYAKLLRKRNDESREVNCPLAKALVLGIRAAVPIFVEEAVLSKAGIAAGAWA